MHQSVKQLPSPSGTVPAGQSGGARKQVAVQLAPVIGTHRPIDEGAPTGAVAGTQPETEQLSSSVGTALLQSGPAG